MKDKTLFTEEKPTEQGLFSPTEDELLEVVDNIVDNERTLLWKKLSKKGVGRNWSKYFDTMANPSEAFKRFIQERLDEILENIEWQDELEQQLELKEKEKEELTEEDYLELTDEKEKIRVNGMLLIIDFYILLCDIFINKKYISKDPSKWIKKNILPAIKEKEEDVFASNAKNLIVQLATMTNPNMIMYYSLNVRQARGID